MTRPELLVVAMSLLPAAWSVHAGGFLPIVLPRRRQLVYAGEERRDLPHVSLGERLVPGGHAGIADAGANHVEDVPFRIIRWMKDEAWRRGIERFLKGRGLAADTAMAKRAIHGVDLQALDQILVRGGYGIVQAGSMTFHRIVERAHGDVDFHRRGSAVGPGRQKAEQGKAKAANQQNQNSDDNPQNEVAHFRSSESFTGELQPRTNYSYSTFKGAATEPTRPLRSSRTTKRTVYSPGARSRAPL